VIMEWDKAENAQKFASGSEFKELRKKAGVIGEPTVAAIVAPA